MPSTDVHSCPRPGGVLGSAGHQQQGGGYALKEPGDSGPREQPYHCLRCRPAWVWRRPSPGSAGTRRGSANTSPTQTILTFLPFLALRGPPARIANCPPGSFWPPHLTLTPASEGADSPSVHPACAREPAENLSQLRRLWAEEDGVWLFTAATAQATAVRISTFRGPRPAGWSPGRGLP